MSEPQITWGAGLTPEELAARLAAHPFAAVREPLMQRILLAALAPAQAGTPVRTGHLRRSETTRVEAGGLRGYLGSNVVYAPFVHARVPFFQLGIDQSARARQKLLQDAGDEYLQGLV
jgi:hypothetical protein